MNETNQTDLQTLLPKVREIARQAGQEILKIYNTDFVVENKKDNSPLTAADMAAHRCICEGLGKLTPEIPILSEESTDVCFTERQTWKQYWLVDPLDGTREFVKRNGEFSVNIALIEKHQSILGVIYIPVTDITYSASQNNGAFRHDTDNSTSRIKVKQTKSDSITVAGSRSHGNERLRTFISKLNDPEVLSIGSSLKFCIVAEGKADIYPRFGPTSEWDTAAAQCIVEEAGGCVVDLEFDRFQYNKKESLLNPPFLVIADNNFDWKRYL